MLVTGVSTNTLTVTRGQEGTTAAAHSDGTPVTGALTARALAQFASDIAVTSTTTINYGPGFTLSEGPIDGVRSWSHGRNSAYADETLWSGTEGIIDPPRPRRGRLSTLTIRSTLMSTRLVRPATTRSPPATISSLEPLPADVESASATSADQKSLRR